MKALASDRWEPLRTGPPGPLLGLLSNEDLDTLARCAVAGTFDAPMFDELLFAGGRGLAELENLMFIVSAGSGSAHKRLAAPLGGADGAFWSLWTSEEVPDLVRDLSAELAGYCQERVPRPLERIRHLLLAGDEGQEAARAEFADLFRGRDEAFDIPGCWDLIALLDDPARSRRLSRELTELREHYRLRTLMRSAFYDDFLLTRSPAYLSRPGLEQTLSAVLGEDKGAPWLALLHGIGGTGKTTLLRWFASRRCVGPDPDAALNALCVRIDGSVARTEELLDRPWLIIIEVAAQLRGMTQSEFFDALLEEYGAHQGRMMLGAGAVGSYPPEPDPEQLARMFAAALRGPGGAPRPRVVLLLDNMDDLYLWGASDAGRLENFFRLLEQLHDLNDGIRVVVAGRYDFRVPSTYVRGLGQPTAEVSRFTRAEAELALRQRGITDRRTVAAIVRRSGALPYVVAGFTVLFDEGRNAPTPEEIEASTEPVIDYLSRRIVEQVVDPLVRWILRYACVPALFSREFVEDVMLPVVREHRGGPVRTEFDEPADSRRRRRLVRPRSAEWAVPAADDVDSLARLWNDVRLQLRALPWFSALSSQSSAFTVERDLRRALRSQVARHEAALAIHARALESFQAAAESAALSPDPVERQRWLESMQRATYHGVCARDGDGFGVWRDGVRAARALGRLDWAEKLTEYLIIEFELDPSSRTTAATSLEAEAGYEAAVELARISAQRAGMLPGGPRPQPATRWTADSECARRLSSVRVARTALSKQRGARYEPGGGERILTALEATRGAGGFDDSALDDVRRLVQPASSHADSELDDDLLRDAWLVLASAARLVAGPGPDDAENAYELAFDRACRAADGAAWVAAEAAAWQLSEEHAGRALHWCDIGMDFARDSYPPEPPDAGAIQDLRGMRVSLLLDLGRPTQALDAIGEYAEERSYDGLPAQLAIAAAEAHVALCRPLAARADLAEVGLSADDGVEAALSVDLARARIHALLLNYDGAATALDRAEALARSGASAWRARVAVARAWLELDCTGNLPLARHALAADFDQLPLDAPERFELELARVELARQSVDAEALTVCLRSATNIAYRAGGTRAERIRVQCAELAAAEVLRVDRGVALLHDLLGELESEVRASGAARLRLFAPLRRCRALSSQVDALAPLRDRLRALFPPPANGSSGHVGQAEKGHEDTAYQYDVLADLYRVFGDMAGAVVSQEKAAHILASRDPFIYWCRLEAAWRVGAEPLRRQPDPAVFRDRYGRRPELVSAMLCAWVTAYDPDAASADADELLSVAASLATEVDGRPSLYLVHLHERLAARSGATPEQIAASRAEAERMRALLGHPLRDGDGAAHDVEALVEFVEAPWGLRVVTSAPGHESTTEDLALPMATAARAFVESVESWRTGLGRLPSESLETRLRDFGGAPAPALSISCTGTNFAAQPWELLTIDGTPAGRHAGIGGLLRHHTAVSLEEGRARLAWRLLEEHYASDDEAPEAPGVYGLATMLRQYFTENLAQSRRISVDAQLTTRVIDDLATACRQRRREAPRPLRVWILNPAIGNSMRMLDHFHRRIDSVSTAYHLAAGALWPRVKVFNRQGAEVQAFADGAYATPEPADIVHVCGVVRGSRELPVLGGDGPNGPLSTRVLGAAVRRLTGTAPPLVVLDFTTSENPTDLRRHLLLRNRFAHQLLALGGIDTIVASGFEPDRETRQLACLTREIARGGNAATICREVRAIVPPGADAERSAAGEVPEACIPYWGTALFSSLPIDAIYEPGLFT